MTEGTFATWTTEQRGRGDGGVHEACRKLAPWKIEGRDKRREEERGGGREEKGREGRGEGSRHLRS